MLHFLFLAVAATVAVASDLPQSCDKPVYCNSDLLHYVQMARVENDSKTYVDLQLLQHPNITLAEFQILLEQTNNSPTKAQIQQFVDDHFVKNSGLDIWTPTDYSPNPTFLARIRDEKLRQFGKNIHDIWPSLGRKVKQEIFDKPDQFSFIPVTHGFIVPGGRFTEMYYWDTYWVFEGLLISGMKDTVKGMLENFIDLLKQVGHIPNGSRWYYQQRSQPPLFIAMVNLYLQQTQDWAFINQNIGYLEQELQYWLDYRTINVTKNDVNYKLLHYYAKSEGPRPESYYEDYTSAQVFNSSERQTEFYVDIKSAAESGWDFSSRWMVDEDGGNIGNLTDVHTRNIIPVELNAIFANALQTLSVYEARLGNFERSKDYGKQAKQWRYAIEKVLWDDEDGIWYDWNVANNAFRKFFYPTNVAPLWVSALERRLVRRKAPRVIKYLRDSNSLTYPGGIPTSFMGTGEQWDYPNAWPPLVSIIVNALEKLGQEGKDLAFSVAQTWVRACHQGFLVNKQMFEKYDVLVPGSVGGGGEYNVQDGFGWSNGVVLEFLVRYGQRLTAYD